METREQKIARLKRLRALREEKERRQATTGVLDFAGEAPRIVGDSLNPRDVPDPTDPTNEAALSLRKVPTLDELALRALGERAIPEGPSVGQRFDVSMKSSDKGEHEYLKHEGLRQLIVPSDDTFSGEKKIVTGDGGETWYDQDPAPSKNFWGDLPGDLADMGGTTIRNLPGIIAAWLTGGTSVPIQLAAGAAADTLGEVVQQGYGAALPGDEGLTVGDRVTRGAVNVGTGLGLNSLAAAYHAAKFSTRLGDRVLKEEVFDPLTGKVRPAKEVLEERLLLEQETGTQLTPSQLTGSKELADLESASKPQVQAALAGQQKSLDAATDKALSQVAPDADVNVRDVTASKVKELKAERKAVAGPKYDEIKELENAPFGSEAMYGRKAGGKQPGAKAAQSLSDIRSRYGDSPTLRKLQEELDAGVSADRFEQLKSEWGNRAKADNPIDGLDSNSSRTMAAEVKDALEKQLQTNTALKGSQGAVASKLQEATEAYKEKSAPINEILTDKKFRTLLKRQPEDAAKSAAAMSEGDLRQSLAILGKIDKPSQEKLKRGIADQLLDTSSAEALHRSLTKNEAKLKIALGDNEAATASFENIRKITELVKKAPKGESQSFTNQLLSGVLAVTREAAALKPFKTGQKLIALIARPLNERTAKKMLQDRELTRVILRLSKQKPELNAKEIGKLAGKFVARWSVLELDDTLRDETMAE